MLGHVLVAGADFDAEVDAITADGRDVRVASVSGQHRQHTGAHYFGLAGALGLV